MSTWKRLSVLISMALMIGHAGGSVNAEGLGVGDSAPKLEVKAFVKGEPVRAFEPGKNYVVEFWATWCGPCRTSIPHLTELQKKYPGITFIGVSVFEQDQGAVKPFVEKMGDKMKYLVAIDAVPNGSKRDEGAMAASWMKAAEQDGIPTAFIVNKEGKIAWIGHPMEMDEPLEKIAAGTWDLKTAAEEQRKEKAERNKDTLLLKDVQKAAESGDARKLLSAIDALVSQKPEIEEEPGLARLKLATLIKLDQQDKALEFGKKLEKTAMGQDPEELNTLAWTIIDPDSTAKPNMKLVQFALELARRADDKTGHKKGAIADTLAKAYFDSGAAAKAVETQERAIRLTKEEGETVDQDMKDRLEKYKKAASQ